ncbi:hypothetical protein [Roseomonas elaeocarpi]|uniref:Glycosyltransferase RgtA/B/C/D-like domain-containing protein n=1 Tax=Roseomonas elaeocarpi TaxID=907779 RepID=A0ABV6JSI4_9PROT
MSRPSGGGWRRVLPAVHPGVALLLVALALRLPGFGNPVLDVDEEFYLLVGDRLLHGALPFVDIWDRKPAGLFLIYAAIRLLGGTGILQYQLVATLSAAATATVIARIARRFAPGRGAILAGVAYLLWLDVLGGQGGQSPVFYNLPVALAALLTLGAVTGAPTPSRLRRQGCAVMLLTGLAMQIKYTAVFEGVFFGCALLLAARRGGAGPGRLAANAAAWIGCALLPTALVLGFFVAIGQGGAFAYANFVSIFQRSAPEDGSSLVRLGKMAAYLAPLAICAVLSRWPHRPAAIAARAEAAAAQGFVVAWAGASVAGVLVFGTYYNHYALPMLVPLAAAAAPLLATADPRRALRAAFAQPSAVTAGHALRLGFPLLALFAALVTGLVMHRHHLRNRGDGSQVRAIADYLRPRLHDCLFIFEGEPILYHLTGSCLATRYAFPSHLADAKEAGATGVVPEEEVARILGTRPEFVLSDDAPLPRSNRRSWAVALEALEQNYHPVLRVQVGKRQRVLYRRNDAG